jgi:acyl-CoA synthetase (NDP forming)
VLKECGRAGARAVVVITAGFRETVEAGARAEEKLLAIARRYGIRIVGPNSVGIINTAIGMNPTFAETAPFQFDVGMFSQSGALATAILDWAQSTGLGFSADVTDVDVLEFLGNDPETRIIVGYVEGITDGRRLMKAARRITPVKPVIVVKVGATQSGVRAASSYTGALATRDAVVDAGFRQIGIIRAGTMAQLFDLTRVVRVRAAAGGASRGCCDERGWAGRDGIGRDRAYGTFAGGAFAGDEGRAARAAAGWGSGGEPGRRAGRRGVRSVSIRARGDLWRRGASMPSSRC